MSRELLLYGPPSLITLVGFILLLTVLLKKYDRVIRIKLRPKHSQKTNKRHSIKVAITIRDHLGEVITADLIRYSLSDSGLNGIRFLIPEDLDVRKHMSKIDIKLIT